MVERALLTHLVRQQIFYERNSFPTPAIPRPDTPVFLLNKEAGPKEVPNGSHTSCRIGRSVNRGCRRKSRGVAPALLLVATVAPLFIFPSLYDFLFYFWVIYVSMFLNQPKKNGRKKIFYKITENKNKSMRYTCLQIFLLIWEDQKLANSLSDFDFYSFFLSNTFD